MEHMYDYDRNDLLLNMKEDPTLISHVPETAYFTLNGQPTGWVIPSELTGDYDAIFARIEEMQSEK